MEINLENFNVRRSSPFIAGNQGLPEGTERYIARAKGLIGLEIFKGDNYTVNIFGEGELPEKINLSGYRTVFNTNDDGGQTVFHIHMHLIGGRKMDWPPG